MLSEKSGSTAFVLLSPYLMCWPAPLLREQTNAQLIDYESYVYSPINTHKEPHGMLPSWKFQGEIKANSPTKLTL